MTPVLDVIQSMWKVVIRCVT